MYERQREAWEKAAKGATKRFGPPNWLVQESMKPGEDFTACAVRIKEEIFGVPEKLAVPEKSMEQVNVPDEPVPYREDFCEDCGTAPKAEYRKVCNACRMRRKRNGAEGAEA